MLGLLGKVENTEGYFCQTQSLRSYTSYNRTLKEGHKPEFSMDSNPLEESVLIDAPLVIDAPIRISYGSVLLIF